MKRDKDTLNDTYDAVLLKTTDLIREGVDPHVVAAALVAVGASIYRTTMTDADYDCMMTAVYDQRDLVQRLTVTDAATLQ